jgi:hypothetical protein
MCEILIRNKKTTFVSCNIIQIIIIIMSTTHRNPKHSLGGMPSERSLTATLAGSKPLAGYTF